MIFPVNKNTQYPFSVCSFGPLACSPIAIPMPIPIPVGRGCRCSVLTRAWLWIGDHERIQGEGSVASLWPMGESIKINYLATKVNIFRSLQRLFALTQLHFFFLALRGRPISQLSVLLIIRELYLSSDHFCFRIRIEEVKKNAQHEKIL